MDTIGVRELRQHASEILRRVAAGDTVEITLYGEPVAMLTPLPDVDPLERLRLAGDYRPASRPGEMPPPIKLPLGSMSASEALAELRADER